MGCCSPGELGVKLAFVPRKKVDHCCMWFNVPVLVWYQLLNIPALSSCWVLFSKFHTSLGAGKFVYFHISLVLVLGPRLIFGCVQRQGYT